MTEAQRIAVVLPSTGFGGAERQAWLAARHLAADGRCVAVFAMGGGDGLAARCATAGLPLVVLPRVESRFRLLATWRLRRAAATILAWRPQAMLPFCSAPNVLCGLIAAGDGPATAWNQRDEGLFPQHPAHEHQALTAAAVVTANGPGAAAWLAGRGQHRVRSLANATLPEPPAADRLAWRERLGIPAKAPLAVMPATFSPAKDHPSLLRAWALVESSLPEPWLALVGADGGELSRLRTLATSLDLRRIAWAGRTEDVTGLLAASDLGVLVSRSEGLSNAVLECRAAGLAVVGSDIPGIRAAAGAGSLLVPSGEVPALAGALLGLLDDPARRTALATHAREGLAGVEALDAWLTVVDDLLRSRRP